MKGTRTYQNAAVVGVFVTLVAVAMAIVQYKIPTILPVLMTDLHTDAMAGSWLMCEGSMADFDAGSMRTAVSAATAEITPSMTIGR